MSEEIFIIVVVGAAGIGFIAVISIVAGVVKSVLKTRERERSRREIAAYVAEGSMTSEEGVKLMDAGRPAWERDLWQKRQG